MATAQGCGIDKAEYGRKSEQFKRQLAEAQGRVGEIAPDLRKIDQRLSRIGRVIDLVREGSSEEQREAIDALVERAEEKDGKLVRVVLREWSRGLLDE
jgi:hypothetical protein